MQEKQEKSSKNANLFGRLMTICTNTNICANMTIAPLGLFWGKFEIICSV